MKALEAFLGSFGILLFGFVSIPLVGWLWGADITFSQGFWMGLTFFVLRFIWLYLLRVYFSRRKP